MYKYNKKKKKKKKCRFYFFLVYYILESHADFLIYNNTLHTNLLHKFGAEQIYGKPKRKDKININFKAFRFVL